MNIISYILIIISIIFIIIGILFFYKSKQLTIVNNKKQEEYNEKLRQEKDQYTQDIQRQINEQEKLYQQYEEKKAQLKGEYSNYITQLQKQTEQNLNNITQAKDNYFTCLEQEYQKIEQDYDKKIITLEQEKEKVNNQINDLKKQLSAGVEAQLRKQEQQDKMEFYKLSISSEILQEIKILEEVKSRLKYPIILNKLIWSTYFQKQANDLCNRVIGTQTTSGIYKITNTKTEQAYIGQSVDIAARFKQHIKCGLGIDASSTNKLYNAMQNYGVWNFTFEVIEKCTKTELNNKEKFWIEMFQTDKFGYNVTKGGS